MMFDNDDTWMNGHDLEARHREAIEKHPLNAQGSYRRLLEAVVAATRDARTGQQYCNPFGGFRVIEAIMRAVNENGWKILDGDSPDVKIEYWHHKNRFRLAGKTWREPYIHLHEVQEATATYLQLPYRVPALDRILVDMLVAAELLAFADEVQPILNRKMPLLLGWLLGNVLSVFIGSAIAALCLWIGDGGTVLTWVGGIIFAITLLWTAWSLIAYPFHYPKIRAQHNKVEDIIRTMQDAYAALAGSPASSKHIDEMLAKATDNGAVWPSQLFVLMEDIRARSVTI